jgi:hypothetical protein
MGYITELVAINEMLISAGERPVTSLVSPEADIEVAQAILSQSQREHLLTGIAGNMSVKEYTPDPGTGKVLLPLNTLNINLYEQPYSDQDIGVIPITDSGSIFLFNVTDSTDVFSDIDNTPIKLIVTLYLDFENIPVAVQGSIIATAKQRYQMITQGNPETNQQLIRELQQAAMQSRSWDSTMKSRSILNPYTNPTARLLYRSPDWYNTNGRIWKGGV